MKKLVENGLHVWGTCYVHPKPLLTHVYIYNII